MGRLAGLRLNWVRGLSWLAVAALLVLAACGPGGGCAPPPPPPNNAALIVGSWLGPDPGCTDLGQPAGFIDYVFESNDNWSAQVGCSTTFNIGGTYSISGNTLVFHYTMCPEACPGDVPVTITFVNDNALQLSGVSGTYFRQ